MHVSVIGHSDSMGLLLRPGEESWPVLLQNGLTAALNEPAQVDSWRFAPYGPRAVSFAIDKVVAAQPDVVILPVASYWCAFGRVANRVRQRYGERAERWYLRAENGFVAHAERDKGPGKPTNTRSRRFVRKVIGVAAYAGQDEVTEVYATIVRRLAQQEHLQMIVMRDHRFTPAVRAANPTIDSTLAHFDAVIRPIADTHLFAWADIEEALNNGGRRDEMIISDGVHVTAEGHARVAAMLLPVLREITEPTPA
ncbi:MAG: SGNH/GDSL hydrolase family protein [Tepidiformaceae bacterium]